MIITALIGFIAILCGCALIYTMVKECFDFVNSENHIYEDYMEE